ncbi:MAG: CAP domain-containing protein [Solirubrobacteraceae bacterium]
MCTARRRGAAATAVLAVTMIAFSPTGAVARTGHCAHASARVSTVSLGVLQRTMVCLINQQRVVHGLPRLWESPRLNRSAQDWTVVMVHDQYFSHGADFGARISATGFLWSEIAENIATGYRTPAGVVRAWIDSAGHCQNILSPVYRYAGAGVSPRSISGYSNLPGTWTMDFGLWTGESPASANWRPADGCPY